MAEPNILPISQYTNNFKIEIISVSTGIKIEFGAFLSSFNDSFKTNFKTQNVYGRMDPIINYQNTSRTISISFVVPSSSEIEGINNLQKISNLIKFQYPEYNATERVSGISSPPICKMKFQNLVGEYEDYLYGYFAGVDFVPTNEAGFFIDGSNNLYPKEFKVSLTFTVLHTNAVGWKKNKWSTDGFYPYKSLQPQSSVASADTTNTAANDIEPSNLIDEANGNDVLV